MRISPDSKKSGSNVEVFTWTFPGAPVSVRLDVDVVARLARLTAGQEPDKSRATEHGGVLLGRTSPDGTIEMTDCAPAAAGNASLHHAIAGLRERLSEGKQVQESTRVVGYYRTLSSGRIVLEEPDLEILDASFHSQDNVVLLVKPELKGPATAGFFFWDGDEVYSDFCFLEFPLDSAVLPTSKVLRTVQATAPPEKSNREASRARSAVPERTARPIKKSWGLLAGVSLVVSLGIIGWFMGRRTSHRSPEPASSIVRPAPVAESPRQTRQAPPAPIPSPPEHSISAPVAAPLSRTPGSPVATTNQQPAGDAPRAPIELPSAEEPKVEVAPPIPAAKPVASAALPSERKADVALPDPAPVSSPPPVIAQVKPPQTAPPPAIAQIKPPQTAPLPSTIPSEAPKASSRPDFIPPAPAPRSTEASDKLGKSAVVIEPQPVRQVQPAVPQSALKMLSKEIVITVQLRIDAAGNVVSATYKSPGGTFSKYFAERAVAAARLWRFEPAKIGTQNVPSDKVLEFRFSPLPH